MAQKTIGSRRYCSFHTNCHGQCLREDINFGRDEAKAAKHLYKWIDYLMRNDYDFSVKSIKTETEDGKETYIRKITWTAYNNYEFEAVWTFKNFK